MDAIAVIEAIVVVAQRVVVVVLGALVLVVHSFCADVLSDHLTVLSSRISGSM